MLTLLISPRTGLRYFELQLRVRHHPGTADLQNPCPPVTTSISHRCNSSLDSRKELDPSKRLRVQRRLSHPPVECRLGPSLNTPDHILIWS